MTKVQVITGGTGGMGIAIAKGFTKDSTILLADISEQRLQTVSEELQQDGYTNVSYITCDVSKQEDIQKLADKAKELGELGSLIHTAGVSPASFDARSILNINLLGTVLLLNTFEEQIVTDSVAVCIASMSGHIAPTIPQLAPLLENPLSSEFPNGVLTAIQDNAQAAYPISKKAVIDIVEKRATTWGKKGGRIVSVSPGLINTPMGAKEAENPDTTNMMKHMNPLGRFGEPVEIADAVHFLISRKASYINGTDLRVDGGITPVIQQARK